jgi:hypothetical protein
MPLSPGRGRLRGRVTMVYVQTASRFCLRQCGRKSTVSDRRNPADLHRLTLTHSEPLFARCAALVARRAEIYGIQSASFRTSGKEIVTWFGPGDMPPLPAQRSAARVKRHAPSAAASRLLAPRDSLLGVAHDTRKILADQVPALLEPLTTPGYPCRIVGLRSEGPLLPPLQAITETSAATARGSPPPLPRSVGACPRVGFRSLAGRQSEH